jgi:hypothetical protein
MFRRTEKEEEKPVWRDQRGVGDRIRFRDAKGNLRS